MGSLRERRRLRYRQSLMRVGHRGHPHAIGPNGQYAYMHICVARDRRWASQQRLPGCTCELPIWIEPLVCGVRRSPRQPNATLLDQNRPKLGSCLRNGVEPPQRFSAPRHSPESQKQESRARESPSPHPRRRVSSLAEGVREQSQPVLKPDRCVSFLHQYLFFSSPLRQGLRVRKVIGDHGLVHPEYPFPFVPVVPVVPFTFGRSR